MVVSSQRLTAIQGNGYALEALRRLVASRKSIAFVGAGASADLYPLWNPLIHMLAERAVSAGSASESDRTQWLRDANSRPLEVLSRISDKLGEPRFRGAIKQIFGPPAGRDPFTSVHSALMSQPFAGYVTTNYDGGLLHARQRLHPHDAPPGYCTWKDQDSLHSWLTGEILQNQDPILFAHGFYERTDTIVSTRPQYQQCYHDALYHQVFVKLWTQEHLVLVGYGFSDPWLDFVSNDALSRTTLFIAGEPRHVAIIGLPNDAEHNTSEIRRTYADTYSAHVVFYPVTVTHDGKKRFEDHSVLMDVFELLLPPPQGQSEGPNPKAFYSGARPTEADISADLDVPRTQYQSSWDDEFGRPQKPWKDLMLRWALTSPQDQKSRVVIVYGHRGSGKTTLLKRMLVDLRKDNIPVLDAFDPVLGRRASPASSSSRGAGPQHRLNAFTELEDPADAESLDAVVDLASSLLRPFTLYIAVDTVHWKTLEHRLLRVFRACDLETETLGLRGQLDEVEIEGLIARLKEHKCLFRLTHKSDEEIYAAFHGRAKKQLLTCLLEATRATGAQRGLVDILGEEFNSLTQNAQWAYWIVLFFGAYGIPVPDTLMASSLRTLTAHPSYLGSVSFVAETAEIVYNQAQSYYVPRNRLIADYLLKRFNKIEYEQPKYRMLRSVLRSLDRTDAQHLLFYDRLLKRKVFDSIRDLDPLVHDVRSNQFDIAHLGKWKFLNAIARIYQGRRDHVKAAGLTEESLNLWDDLANPASYIRGFVLYELGEREEPRHIASRLVHMDGYPYHVLRGIALYCLLGEWQVARDAIQAFEATHGVSVSGYPGYYELSETIKFWMDFGSGTVIDFTQMKPAAALAMVERGASLGSLDLDIVVKRYRELILKDRNYRRPYISLLVYLWTTATNGKKDNEIEIYSTVTEECGWHLREHEEFVFNYSNAVRSVLHSGYGRALFRIEQSSENGYVNGEVAAEHFRKALELDATNWYAHNWYGTYLKDVAGDDAGAERHYRRAMEGDQGNPVFKHNLALHYYQRTRFKRETMEVAWRLALQAMQICRREPRFAHFVEYPTKLYQSISRFRTRSDLREGELIGFDDTLNAA